jgi:PKD repeat protein
VLVSGILGVAAASFAALPFGAVPGANVALACGLGAGPTMLANSSPSLLYPVTTNVPADQPVGLFAPDFAAGSSINLTEDLSRAVGAPDPNTLQWRWNFGDGTSSTGSYQPSHTFTKPGTYNIHSQIYDTTSKSWTDLDSAQIHIVASLPDNPPVARATVSSPLAVFGSSVTFDASASTSSDGSPLKYLWNFNDGQTATGAQVSHQFVVPGKGFVSLTVTDGRGAKGVTTINIVSPQSQLSASASTIAPGKSVTFNETEVATTGSSSSGSSAGQQASFTWSFGDGSQDVTSSQPSVSHTFTKAGQYIVTMQEVDGAAAAQAAGPFEAFAVIVATPPPPPWRYAVGGAAVVLGILLSLGAAVRSQRRQVALAEQRKAARSRRVSATASSRGSRGRYDDDYRDDYRGGGSSRARGPGGSSGRGDARRGGSSSRRQRHH